MTPNKLNKQIDYDNLEKKTLFNFGKPEQWFSLLIPWDPLAKTDKVYHKV
jgi:hypothetical protein